MRFSRRKATRNTRCALPSPLRPYHPLLLLESLESRLLLSVNITTWHNDLTRQGWNSNEIALTPANVNSSAFGQLFSYPVSGQIYGQPLYVSNLSITGQGVHNVVFVVTQHNDVYAFDADSNAGANAGLLWHDNLGASALTPNNFFANRYGPYHDINPQVGITSTPVIDLATGTIYIDAFTNDDPGSGINSTKYSHHIWALDITTGLQRTTPTLVAVALPGTSAGAVNGTLTFTATQQLQRSALTLFNGILYVAYTGYADTNPYHGWILGFNPSTLQLVTAFNTTPTLDTDPAVEAGEGGIWQTGNGLASDGTNLYVMTANGDFNASATSSDWGDTFLKLAPSDPATPNTNGYGLTVSDYFTPFNEQALANADQDLGSGGAILLPDQPGLHPHELVGSGKGGTIYLVDRDNMGHFNATGNSIIQTVSLGGGTFSSPAYFNNTLYFHAGGDVLKAFSLSNGLLSAAPVASGTRSYGSNPGGSATPTISSSGITNGIVWDLQYNTSHEVLHAYNATPNGTALTELYNSNLNIARDQLGAGAKFTTPVIADGKVFVGADGALAIYGQLAPPTTPPAAPTNLVVTKPVAQQLRLSWSSTATNESGFKVERSTDNVNFDQIDIAGVDATVYIDTTVIPGILYYYRVRATNIIGDSAYSNTASSTADTTSSPVNIYRFDEGSGIFTSDSVGTNNGTLSGVTRPSWVPGRIGSNALSFTGDGVPNSLTNQSAVLTTSNLAPVLGNTSTLTAWIQTTQHGIDNNAFNAPAITGVEAASSTNDIHWGYLDASGHIGIAAGNNSFVSSSIVADGNWHHVAFTRNSATGFVQIFVDGILQTSGTGDAGSTNLNFRLIGAQTDISTGGATYLNAQLDDVRIFNKVLTANEIAALGEIPSTPTGLTATAISGSLVQLNWTNVFPFTQNIEIDRRTGTSGSFSQIALLAPNATQYNDTGLDAGTQYTYQIRAIGLAGPSPFTSSVNATPPRPTIIGRWVFYNRSNWDGQNGSSNVADGFALAPDKQALLPGDTATFENYTTYSKGLNGIMIDIANFDAVPLPSDYILKVGNSPDPTTWLPAPTPTFVTGYIGSGINNSTRLEIVFDDNDVHNEWLQVTLLANDNTKLATSDTFYFGNVIGDSGNASGVDAKVTAADELLARANPTVAATLDNPYDYNRDKVVDDADQLIARTHQTNFLNALQLITVPPPPLQPAFTPQILTTLSAAPSFSAPVSPPASVQPQPLLTLPVLPWTSSSPVITSMLLPDPPQFRVPFHLKLPQIHTISSPYITHLNWHGLLNRL